MDLVFGFMISNLLQIEVAASIQNLVFFVLFGKSHLTRTVPYQSIIYNNSSSAKQIAFIVNPDVIDH